MNPALQVSTRLISRVPSLAPILLGEIHRRCPLLVPKVLRKVQRPGMSKEESIEAYK